MIGLCDSLSRVRLYYDQGHETDAEHRLWVTAHCLLVGHVTGVCVPLVGWRSVPSHTPIGHDSTNGLKDNKPRHRSISFFNEFHYDYILNPFLRPTACSWQDLEKHLHVIVVPDICCSNNPTTCTFLCLQYAWIHVITRHGTQFHSVTMGSCKFYGWVSWSCFNCVITERLRFTVNPQSLQSGKQVWVAVLISQQPTQWDKWCVR